MKYRVLLTLFFHALFLRSSESKEDTFRFANIFGSNMVLQKAPKKAKIWGFGEVGEDVKLYIGKFIYWSPAYTTKVKAGPNNVGIWSVELKPSKAGGPYTIKVNSKVNGSPVSKEIKNVLFGDVWICSGQSNMEMQVFNTTVENNDVKKQTYFQHIRLFNTRKITKEKPLLELSENGIRQPWAAPTKEIVDRFSATCWHYGVQLYKSLKYPIGLVEASWFGSPIEAWSSPDALKKCNIKPGDEVLNEVGVETFPPVIGADAIKPSRIWNAMMHPFLKMTIYGFIWYQGETNAGFGLFPYNCTFPAMIDDLREKWQTRIPFGFVQLSASGKCIGGQTYKFAPLRWQQTFNDVFVPNDRLQHVFMAVAMDLGDPDAPGSSIHPRTKEDVGFRLGLAGLSIAYGKNEYHTGPRLLDIRQKKRLGSKTLLQVIFTDTNGKIEVRSRDGFEVLCKNKTVNETQLWKKANITEIGTVAVSIKPPCGCNNYEAVRYAWSDYPCEFKKCAVYSGDLPAPPFIKYVSFPKIPNI